MAGVCTASGKCHCDHWASGSDCSYLDFKPIDKQRLGYTPLRHSTWCGSVLALEGGAGNKQQQRKWLMVASEIACPLKVEEEDDDDHAPRLRQRCGLDGWMKHSRVVEAVADHPAGPYTRRGPLVFQEKQQQHRRHHQDQDPYHHNPELVRDRTSGKILLYATNNSYGPTVRMER